MFRRHIHHKRGGLCASSVRVKNSFRDTARCTITAVVCAPLQWWCVRQYSGGVYTITVVVCAPLQWWCVHHYSGGVYTITVVVCVPVQ